MNSETHKVISAFYEGPSTHYAIPMDWDLKDIKIRKGVLLYKGKPQVIPKIEHDGDENQSFPAQVEDSDYAIEDLDFEEEEEDKHECECGGDFEECPCCGDEYACSHCGLCEQNCVKSEKEEKEEKEDEEDIVFHCESCKKAIVRDSEDHDFSKCHEEKWYCVDCPCEEEEEEEEEAPLCYRKNGSKCKWCDNLCVDEEDSLCHECYHKSNPSECYCDEEENSAWLKKQEEEE